jgi:hypothetical protein
MGTTAEISVPAEIAGIPTERLAPMRDGSVREYDRPVFTETEGVGRHQDPDARRVHIHAPGSEVAEALRPIMAERSKPRAVTRMDIACMEQARDIYAVQGKNDEAASCERIVYRMRAGFAISTRRQATPALAMRSQAVARPRERSDRRASSPSRAGPTPTPTNRSRPSVGSVRTSGVRGTSRIGLRCRATATTPANRRRGATVARSPTSTRRSARSPRGFLARARRVTATPSPTASSSMGIARSAAIRAVS